MSAMPPLKELLDLPKLGKSLKRKRGVLMLGPRIATVIEEGENVPILEGLSMELASQMDELKISYENSAERNLPYISQVFLREQKLSKDDLRRTAKKYIEEKAGTEEYIPPIYEDLAKLPVRVIVNTSPDDFIVRALRKAGKNPEIFTFNFEVNSGSDRNTQQNEVNFDTLGMMRPLVFNLFGNTQDPESMVITEEDQVTFVRNVLEGTSKIPEQVLNLLSPEESTYLFFGFNLENWQFRLLLKSMQFHQTNITLSPQTDNYPVSEITKTYLKHEFNFNFVDVRMDEFAREISKLASSSDVETVYISYADVEDDKKEVDRMLQFFKPLTRANLNLRITHRRLIESGDVEKQVADYINQANIIIPLITINYINDDRVWDTEMPLFESRFKEGEVEVAPVILKPCPWQDLPFFQLENMNRLPDNDLEKLTDDDDEIDDEAFQWVVNAFKTRFL